MYRNGNGRTDLNASFWFRKSYHINSRLMETLVIPVLCPTILFVHSKYGSLIF